MRAWVSDHWVFKPCFLSFLSPYYLSLRYVLGLKTTLRPWYHASCFDSSHVGDTWDWLESILIMISQELWYDPILGHSHLREFFYRVCSHSVWYIASGHTFLGRGLIFLDGHYTKAYFSQSMMDFWVMATLQRRSDVIFHIGARYMIGIFHLVYFA